MITLEQIQSEANKYTQELKQFVSDHDLGELIIAAQVDHVAVKLADTQDFEQFLKYIAPQAKEIHYIEMHNRRIATAFLSTPISCQELGAANYLEIMEPRPEKAGKDTVGFEHIEIVQSDLYAIYNKLVQKKIPCEEYDNGFHKAIVIKINERGWEIKFTNKSLKNTLEDEQRQGKLKTYQ